MIVTLTECDVIPSAERVEWSAVIRAEMARDDLRKIDLAAEMGCSPAYITKLLKHPAKHGFTVLKALQVQDAIKRLQVRGA